MIAEKRRKKEMYHNIIINIQLLCVKKIIFLKKCFNVFVQKKKKKFLTGFLKEKYSEIILVVKHIILLLIDI